MKIRWICGLLAVSALFHPGRADASPASAAPAVVNVQVSNVTADAATISFSSSTPAFAGISYQPLGGKWTTVNEAYGVNHSVTLKGLKSATQYRYMPWASGAPPVPPATFATAASVPAVAGAAVQSLARKHGNVLILSATVSGVALIVALALAAWMLHRRRQPARVADAVDGFSSWPLRNSPGILAASSSARYLAPEAAAGDAQDLWTPEQKPAPHSGHHAIIEVDEELMRAAEECTGLTDRTLLVGHALRLLIHQEAMRRVATRAAGDAERSNRWRRRLDRREERL